MGFFDKWTVKVRAAVDNPNALPGATLRGCIEVETSGTVKANELKVVVQGTLHVKQRKQVSGPDQGDDSSGDLHGAGATSGAASSAFEPGTLSNSPSQAISHNPTHDNNSGNGNGTLSAGGSGEQKNAPKPKYKDFYSDVPVLQQSLTLLGGVSDQSARIPLGIYSYPFEVMLPPDIPPSMLEHFGPHDTVSVSYSCVGVLCVSMAPDTTSEPVPITMGGMAPRVQAATSPPAELCRKFEVVECRCCCCCTRTGLLNVKARVDHSIIVPDARLPGSIVMLTIDVENKTSEPCTQVAAELLQEITYHADGKALNGAERPALKRRTLTTFPPSDGYGTVKRGTSERIMIPVPFPQQCLMPPPPPPSPPPQAFVHVPTHGGSRGASPHPASAPRRDSAVIHQPPNIDVGLAQPQLAAPPLPLPATARITAHYNCRYFLTVKLGHPGVAETLEVPITLFPMVDNTDRAPPMPVEYSFQRKAAALVKPKQNYGTPGQYHVPGQAFNPATDARMQRQAIADAEIAAVKAASTEASAAGAAEVFVARAAAAKAAAEKEEEEARLERLETQEREQAILRVQAAVDREERDRQQAETTVHAQSVNVHETVPHAATQHAASHKPRSPPAKPATHPPAPEPQPVLIVPE